MNIDNKITVIEDFICLAEDLIRKNKPYVAFVLLYIVIKTQLRKLLTFVLRMETHSIHWNHIKKYIGEEKSTNIDYWIKVFDKFNKRSFSDILSQKLRNEKDKYSNLLAEIKKTKQLRNKIFHGVFVYSG